MSMQVCKQAFALALPPGPSSAGSAISRPTDYRDPARVFTLFMGLRSGPFDLDLTVPVPLIGIHPEAVSSLRPSEFPTPGTQFWFH
jgi:hypothetical protein